MESIIIDLDHKRQALGINNIQFSELLGVSPSQWTLLKQGRRRTTLWLLQTISNNLSDKDDSTSRSILDIVEKYLSSNFSFIKNNNH